MHTRKGMKYWYVIKRSGNRNEGLQMKLTPSQIYNLIEASLKLAIFLFSFALKTQENNYFCATFKQPFLF